MTCLQAVGCGVLCGLLGVGVWLFALWRLVRQDVDEQSSNGWRR